MPVPQWARNLALTLLLVGLWPLNRLLAAHMDPYFLLIVQLAGINIILATSLNLINGITGQFSLGHAAFMAIGAYTTGILLRHWSLGETPAGMAALVACLLLGGLLASAAGLLVGIPTLRLRGDYLAIATLGFGEIINTLLINTEHLGPLLVGGASGLHAIPIFAQTQFFWTYAAVLACVVSIWRLVYSPLGKAFLAIREDEVAAAAMGVDTTFYKVAAFAIGAFFAGVAGGLSATLTGNLDPEAFRFMRSIEIVVMVVLGGSGSITGVILAAIFLTYLPELLRTPPTLWPWGWLIIALGGLLLLLWQRFRPSALSPRERAKARAGVIAVLIALAAWELIRAIATHYGVNLADYRLIIYSLVLILMMLLRPEGLLGRREVWWIRKRPHPTALS